VPWGVLAVRSSLVMDFSDGWTRTPGVPRASVDPVPAAVLTRLRSIPGVHGVSVIHTNPVGTALRLGGPESVVAGLVSCSQSDTLAVLGRCAPGADVMSVPPVFSVYPPDEFHPVGGWPGAPITSQRLADVPVQSIVVGTDGSPAVLEQARTVLESAYPDQRQPATTFSENMTQSALARQLAGYQQLANVVILVSLCVAGCGLAVSVVGGLNDRKRPFSLLRLTGVRLGTLRGVIALESVVPLLVNAVLATGTGFLAAGLFLKSQLGYSLHAPGVGYYLMVTAGLAISLAVIASTVPLLKRITGPETARNE